MLYHAEINDVELCFFPLFTKFHKTFEITRKQAYDVVFLILSFRRVLYVMGFSFGYLPGVWVLKADVSEHFIGSIFIGKSMKILHQPAYEDGTDKVFRNVGF